MLKLAKTVLAFQPLFNQNSTQKREVASFEVSDLNKSIKINIKNALVGNLLSTEGERPTNAKDLAKFNHLKDKMFNDLEDKTVGLLLDAKHAWTFMTGQASIGRSDEPIGLETAFGPALIGPSIGLDQGQPEGIDAQEDVGAIDVETSLTEEIRQMYRHDFIMREDVMCDQRHEGTHP